MVEAASGVDAQHQAVGVSYSLQGSRTLLMHVAVPTNVEWPIAVDPVVGVVDTYPGAETTGQSCWHDWTFTQTGGFFPLTYTFSPQAPNSQFISSAAGMVYLAGSVGECVRYPRANSYIYGVQEYNTSLLLTGANATYPVSGVQGLADPVTGTWALGGWEDVTPGVTPYPGGGGYAVRGFPGLYAGDYSDYCVGGCSSGVTTAHDGTFAVFAMQFTAGTLTGSSYPYAGAAGALTFSGDNYPPVLTQDQLTPALPTGWVRSVSETTSLAATDKGMGMSQLSVSGPGVLDLTGQAAGLTATQGCTGSSSSLCPVTPTPYAASIGWQTTAGTPDGAQTITDTASDIVGNQTVVTHQVNIDQTPPVIALSGTLDNTTQTLPAGSYTLNVAATDGSSASPGTQRSGVASIEIDLDGQQVQTASQACATAPYSCPMSQTYVLDTSPLAPGVHTIDVLADDQVGNEAQQSFTFTTGPCCASAPSTWSSGHLQLLEDDAFGDVTGSGSAALVSRNKLTGAVSVSLSTGMSFGSPTVWGTWPSGVLGLGLLVPNVDLRVADVNGDGFADLVGRDPATGSVYVALSNGSSFGTPAVWGTTNPADDYYLSSLDNTGVASLITRNTTTGVVSSADLNDAGTGWDPPAVLTTLPAQDQLTFGNVYDAGSQSIVGYDATSGAVQVSVPQDNAYGPPTTWATLPAGLDVRLADMDAAGVDALMTRSPGSGQLQIYPSDNASSFRGPITWGTLGVDHSFNVTDLNGDGKTDVVGVSLLGDITALISNLQTPLDEQPGFTADDPSLIYDTSDSSLDMDGPPDPTAVTATIASAATAPIGSRMTLAGEADGDILSATTGSGTTPRVESAINRIQDYGAKVIKLIVKWGYWTQEPGYRQGVRNAVASIAAHHMKAYLTLTGGSAGQDAMINGKETSNFVVSPTGFDHDPDINPKAFAAFVTDVVTTFKGQPVAGYSLWNEPNSQSRTFLRALCPGFTDVKRLRTSSLYGVLYQAGYAAARAADPLSHIFFGELNGVSQVGRASCSDKRATVLFPAPIPPVSPTRFIG
ncbi:MAG: hypothetical protein ABI427_08930 [Solirubrobacteraceae bacterium]